jgi:hypothetical protein
MAPRPLASYTRAHRHDPSPARLRARLPPRALKAQALAERFGWPVEIRREAERGHFVRTWLDPAHWTAVDDRFEPLPA